MREQKPFSCPICGGRLIIKLDTGIGVCDSCGQMTELNPTDLKELRDMNSRAERQMRLRSAAGYEEALRLLKGISFAADVDEKIAYCQTQLDALRQKQVRQRSFTESAGKKDTALGTVLIVMAVVFLLAAVAGIVVLIVLWSRGKLPPKAAAVILGVIAVVAVLALIGKAKNSQN